MVARMAGLEDEIGAVQPGPRAESPTSVVLGYTAWKKTPANAYYDSSLVRRVLENLREMREKDDVEGVCAVLEVCLRSNFAGIESFRLYSETYFGTKDRIRDYIEEGEWRKAATGTMRHQAPRSVTEPSTETRESLGAFCYPYSDPLLPPVERSIEYVRKTPLLTWEEKSRLFRYITKNNGSTALCLSGGASFGYYVRTRRRLTAQDSMPASESHVLSLSISTLASFGPCWTRICFVSGHAAEESS